MRATLAVVGYALVALIVFGLALTVVFSVLQGRPFYGVNYMGLPLGTYSTLAMLVAATGVGAVRVIQIIRRRRVGKK